MWDLKFFPFSNKSAAAYEERKNDVGDDEERNRPPRPSSAPLQHAVYDEQPLHSGQPGTGDAQPDLTMELQRVIRDEMRRIMAVRHGWMVFLYLHLLFSFAYYSETLEGKGKQSLAHCDIVSCRPIAWLPWHVMNIHVIDAALVRPVFLPLGSQRSLLPPTTLPPIAAWVALGLKILLCVFNDVSFIYLNRIF